MGEEGSREEWGGGRKEAGKDEDKER